MRVLIVEDHERMAETLARGLRNHAYAVDVALDGEAGLEKALVNEYEVIVLDRDLPKLHGDELCARVRDAGRPARIIMVTAAATTDDLVAGLDLGADDYLIKPFDAEELRLRVHNL
ncbi:MAG: response regulator, partial [Acidimicrobiales bacterium]|nr:response regulator [Acidimicrobiales bacterium]